MDRYIGLDDPASSCRVATVGPKSDKLDAFGLAEPLRIGGVKRRVYKQRGEFGALKHRAKAYTLLVSDSVRVQKW
jgi:hypothetical protein